MSRAIATTAALLTCLASAPAFAVDKPNALGRAEGIYTPRTGDWEFSLNAPAFPVGASSTRGIGATINTGNGGGTTTNLGLGAGLGYCVTDLVEIGGALNFTYESLPGNGFQGGGSNTTLSLEPFVKANFGSGMARDSRLNPFALAALSLGYLSAGGGGSAEFSIELAGGLEFMLTHTWGISVYVPFTFLIPTASNTSAQINIGLGYGIAAYFN